MNNMPPVTKNLLIINSLMLLASIVLYRYGINFYDLLALHYFGAPNFHPYQFVTYMFMHGGLSATGVSVQAGCMHLFFNMFALWMFGRIIEQVFGSKRFLIYYMLCGIGAGLFQELVQYIELSGADVVDQALYAGKIVHGKFYVMDGMAVDANSFRTVGASGAVYGVLLAFGMTFPNERMFIIPIPVPIKAKYMVGGYALIELLEAMSTSGDGVAHMAHLGGMIIGLLLILYWRKSGIGSSAYYGGGQWSGYEVKEPSRQGWFERFKAKFKARKKPSMKVNKGGKHADEMDYNERRKRADEEIDKILDKVKKSGYGALTEDEKRKLFDASGKK